MCSLGRTTLDFDTIIYEQERGRARITFDRPEKLNALSRQIRAEAADAPRHADDVSDHAIQIHA